MAVEEGVVGALEEEEEALGAGAVEVDVLGVSTGAEGMDAVVGVKATGEDGASVSAGAGVTDALGDASLYVTYNKGLQQRTRSKNRSCRRSRLLCHMARLVMPMLRYHHHPQMLFLTCLSRPLLL